MKNWTFLSVNGSVSKDNITEASYDNSTENNVTSEVSIDVAPWFWVS